MNVHKNARSCPASRAELVKRVCEQGWSVREASEAVGISERRGREWIRRSAAGEPLTDRSSRPHRSHRIGQQKREQIIALRLEWRTMRQIAQTAGVSQSTVARICRSAGLSRLRQVDPPAVPVRYGNDPASCSTSISSAWAASIVWDIASPAAVPSDRKSKALSSSMRPPMTSLDSVTLTSWLTSVAARPAPFCSGQSAGSPSRTCVWNAS